MDSRQVTLDVSRNCLATFITPSLQISKHLSHNTTINHGASLQSPMVMPHISEGGPPSMQVQMGLSVIRIKTLSRHNILL